MHQFLIDFLKELKQQVPPPADCHHTIRYARYGNDESGWDDRLAIQICTIGVIHCLFLEHEDFEKEPAQLASEVAALLPKTEALAV